MVKIAVLGAGGRSGRVFVEAALNANYTIRAGIHHSNPFSVMENLEVIRCDTTSYTDVVKLISGCDIVVSLIGHVKGSLSNVQTRSIESVIRAMDDLGLKRVISLTGTGVRFEGDRITLTDRFLNAGISIIDPKRINDGKDHVDRLKASSLDWTVLRVLKLQDGFRGSFRLTSHGPTKILVDRKDVALALLEIMQSESFYHQAPMMSAVKK